MHSFIICSEKLAAIAARKERMREIRAKLVHPVAESPDMDETFCSALQQLKYFFFVRCLQYNKFPNF